MLTFDEVKSQFNIYFLTVIKALFYVYVQRKYHQRLSIDSRWYGDHKKFDVEFSAEISVLSSPKSNKVV